MSRTWGFLALFTLLLISASAIAIDPADAADPPKDPLPQDLYPGADIIITADAKGNTLVTFKAYGDYVVTKDHPSEWFSLTYSQNTDVVLRNLSEADDYMEIVYDGAIVRKLTVFNVDTKESLNAADSVHLTMYSGSIQTLTVLSVSNQIKQYIGNSYDSIPATLRNVILDLNGGTINLFNPTSNMLGITNYTVHLDYGLSVNRLYITGENGKYSSVHIDMNGAEIGYMSNIASRIGSLVYDLNSGSIDYFSIGANTEHNYNRSIGDMATFHVTGDVKVHIGSSATIGKCIMGGGILNMPRILCNGTLVSEEMVHMVVIDAQGTTVHNDSAFLTERRTSAYHFGNYRIGGNPSASSISDSFTYLKSTMKVYSEEGVWTSYSSCTIPVGGIVSLNTKFIVQSDGYLNLAKGASLYNSDDMVISGSLIIGGTLINNSVIQCRSGSVIEGTPEGIGYLADYVHYSSPTSSLNVMSQRNAVVIDQETQYPVESISTILAEDNLTVTITIEGSRRIFGDQFMIALNPVEPPESFDGMYRLDIKGIDRDLLAICTVEITLPTNHNLCTAVYVFNESEGQYEMISAAEYESQVFFTAGTYNEFYLMNYTSERPNPSQPIVINTDMTWFDYVLVAAIIAVLAVTVYALVTMKRD